MDIRIPRMLYQIYGAIVFMGVFFLILPGLLLSLAVPRWAPMGMYLDYLWTYWILVLYGLPVRLHYKAPLSRKISYVFCANHSSFLDIPAIAQCKFPMVFVGKSALEKIPFFGYVYKRMHITVDRNSMRSSYAVLPSAKQALAKGNSLVFFPEGGIISRRPPRMGHFKDGAFRTAIEAQVPIVPTTLLDAWRVFPKYPPSAPYAPRPLRVVYHAPIPTQGMNLQDIHSLKEKTRTLIEKELLLHFPTIMQAPT